MMRQVVLALALCAAACSVPVDVAGSSSAALADAPALTIWPADDRLATLAGDAAFRLEEASGLRVEVGDAPDAIPLVWSDSGAEAGWLGMHFVRESAEWLAIDEAVPNTVIAAVVLHEITHALGAEHVPQDAGLLSPRLSAEREWRITSADLEAICAEQACARFAPEGQ